MSDRFFTLPIALMLALHLALFLIWAVFTGSLIPVALIPFWTEALVRIDRFANDIEQVGHAVIAEISNVYINFDDMKPAGRGDI